jgi:hypothetical protein
MSQAQGIKTIASLTEALSQISRRLESNPSALPIELALMSQKAIELYNEIKKLESQPSPRQSEPAPPMVTIPPHQRSPEVKPVPAPKHTEAPPVVPTIVAEQPAQVAAKVETPERKPAPETAERKREKLQRLEETPQPVATAAPTPPPAQPAKQPEPAPATTAKKSQISDIYAQAREKANMAGVKSVNEKLRTPEPKASLNESFAGTQVKKNLVDKLKLSPIANLNSAMSVNQKAHFIQELFNGDDKEFKRIITFVNGSSNFSEAKFYLQSEIGPMNGWKDDNPLVQEFMELVYRKFL